MSQESDLLQGDASAGAGVLGSGSGQAPETEGGTDLLTTICRIRTTAGP